MFASRSRLLFIAILLVASTLGGVTIGNTSPVEAQTGGLTVDVLKNITYPLDLIAGKQAALRDGRYEYNTPPLRGNVTFVNAAISAPRAAVLLSSNTGGSGVFLTLHLVTVQNGAPVAGPGVLLGDRQTVEAFTIAGETVRIGLLTQGSTDPQCCPTQRETRDYVVDGNQFRLTSTTIIQPGSGSSIAPAPPKTGNGGLLTSGARGTALALALAALAVTLAARGATKHPAAR